MSEPIENREGRLREVPVWRVGPGDPRHPVVRESVVQVVLNSRPLVRMNCLPDALDDLVLGFLASEGLIEDRGAVHEIRVSADGARIDARADVDPYRLLAFRERIAMSLGCGGGASAAAEDVPRSRSSACFRPDDVSSRMTELHHASALFRETGGVHAAAVTDGLVLSAFAEDIGRHNAVDKTIGRCLTQGIAFDQRLLLTTGRLCTDVLSKAIRVGLPAVVSRGAVTSRAIELAASADVAAVGFARGQEMNVYTAPWRFGLAERDETAGP